TMPARGHAPTESLLARCPDSCGSPRRAPMTSPSRRPPARRSMKRTSSGGYGCERSVLRALRIRPRPFYNCRHTYISMLLDAGAKPLFVCRQTGTSLEMIEKHYGDARVDADQLDEMIGELESPTGNLPGTLPDADDDSLPSKVKEPF